ncbi:MULTISPECIES: DNA recombination protein RmuC [unclassified Shewanella]|uniref:DNA recombination protein RmuC n=1 Tax=unclassified Shewanella TaxID=196818 RepID=UPI000C829766|nr:MULTISPECIES: DNA recombination protein RmuC [unclassified Shewanella]MDO6621053.1 DNA recombination protein RmuC [Shewanella sp. 6_MG-2023]MDO6641753.1 DNA recombination protein RmuC [Shewanella sp. 5_MG-2023]MDO6680416.1 DNA recombination protein RmuC [Shewanella sp. 4_MG-2023]MDO6776906.1 DNA recombination protein RmuC [Shewanella sp. 3_MG-2023]PMG29909.1 recombinase RmuC [Shewanella sp. 10N.286.52.C2]
MTFPTSLTIPEIIVLAAVAFLSLLIGALLNQRLTRQRWEQHRQRIAEEMSQLTAEFEIKQQSLTEQIDDKQDALMLTQNKLESLIGQLAKMEAFAERVPLLEQQLNDGQRKFMETQLALSKSNAIQQSIQAQANIEKTALNDKIALLESAEERLKLQFENLANRIFEEKSENFKKQNVSQMDGVLGPLKQQLEGFRQQVRESYSQEQTERSALKHQLDALKELNLRMSQDAVNLTKALKGDNKQQGNWGEVILERVLQESGLREGHEYHTQQDLKDDQGKRFKPDVIVHLPEQKDVVIDAKMSLIAYERFFNSEDELVQQQAIKELALSIRQHIKGLSHKDYHKLHGLKSLDYVLMFIPIEPAFLLALESDPSLVNFALDHNIMLVSPTNLLVALRTINNIWRYEYQNQNAQSIAAQAGKIYDKLCSYVDDMDKLGRALDTADKAYQQAMNKLSQGKGNLIRQAHVMQKLGVETSKNLDPQLINKALDDSKES